MQPGWNKISLSPQFHLFDEKGRSACGKYLAPRNNEGATEYPDGTACKECAKHDKSIKETPAQ